MPKYDWLNEDDKHCCVAYIRDRYGNDHADQIASELGLLTQPLKRSTVNTPVIPSTSSDY
jgi:hypothetical protein